MIDISTGPTSLDRLAADFSASREEYDVSHRGAHWDVFADDFAKVFEAPELWAAFRRNALSAGFGSATALWTTSTALPDEIISKPKEIARLTQLYDQVVAEVGVDRVRELIEAEIGEPSHYPHLGLRLNEHDLRLITDVVRVDQFIDTTPDRPLRIVEIGGGFGSFALKMHRLRPTAQIIIYDLPEVNAVQRYYLTRAAANATMIGASEYATLGSNVALETATFGALPGWRVADLPEESVDVVVNTRSMMEMPMAIVGDYFKHIHRVLRPGGVFYCVNRYHKDTSGDVNRIRDYPFDDRWYFTMSEPSKHQPWIHIIAAIRTRHPNVNRPKGVLAALPPYGLRDVVTQIGWGMSRFWQIIAGNHDYVNPGVIRYFLQKWRDLRRKYRVALRRRGLVSADDRATFGRRQ